MHALLFLCLSSARAIEPADSDDQQSIINGAQATEADYPSAGAIIVEAEMPGGGGGGGPGGTLRTLMCSSTLIAPDVVLTAGHCVLFEDYFPPQAEITVYWTRQADLSGFAQWGGGPPPDLPSDSVEVTDWVAHPQFSLQTMTLYVDQCDDIALLFLSEPVLDIEPAYVITADEGKQILEGDSAAIAGWGQIAQDGTYGTKFAGTTTLGEVGPWEMHVGPLQSDVRQCHGDSGGPVYMDVDTDSPVVQRVVGVTSHAYDQTDCTQTGGVDTRVDAYLDFLDDEMRAACKDGTRVWCDEPGLIAPPEKEEPVEDTGDTGGSGAPGNDPNAPSDDTGSPVPPTDLGGDGEEPGGCGCATPAPSALWLGGLALLAAVRRRER